MGSELDNKYCAVVLLSGKDSSTWNIIIEISEKTENK
jgi:hypothetical protein